MMKRASLWCVVMVVAFPAISTSGGIGTIERQDAVSEPLEHKAQELTKGLSSYRYEGSLWEERSAAFYMDNTARMVNDVVMVKIDEISDASQQMSTKTSRDSSILASITKFLGSPLDFGLKNLWGKDATGAEVPFKPELESSAKSSHSGSGKITGSGKLSASVTAKVIEVIPNGNLVIEGRKEVTIDNEKRLIVLSGMVRPEDIAFDNSVSSSKIADVRIEYVGTGVISDKQKPGRYHRIFDWLYPF